MRAVAERAISSAAHSVLTVEEMGRADSIGGMLTEGSFGLMRRAGTALARIILEHYPHDSFDVLCGPGNNGGDGYVVAELLRKAGRAVGVWAASEPRSADAGKAAAECCCAKRDLREFVPSAANILVDALYGAGLSRPVDGEAKRVAELIRATGCRVVAVDLPSGVAGDLGSVPGSSFDAELTVTFVRKKPAHLLFPGRGFCGKIVVADIGIPNEVIASLAPSRFENHPELWRATFPRPEQNTHKYRRGHLAVCSGGAHATGAARLSALAGARAGAGAVTLLSPTEALAVNAAHLTAIMLRPIDSSDDLVEFLRKTKCRGLVLGPGFGDLEKARAFALAALQSEGENPLSVVLDADGITAFRDRPQELFDAAKSGEPRLILTPHEGEFSRLFPDLAEDETLSKLQKAQRASARSHAVVVLKGADTVIAEPQGRTVINSNATPYLATAGSGDVLAGLSGGLLAQNMPAFDAACAAVWLHAEAGTRFGPGLFAEDLPGMLPAILHELAA